MNNFKYRSRNRRGTGSFNRRPKYSGRGFGNTSFNVFAYINRVSEAPKTELPTYVVKNKFSDFKLNPLIIKTVQSAGYINPTPIQDSIIPHIIEGRDVVGLANTGTGKTAAFLIPLINSMVQNPKESVIILAPTRELVLQIEAEIRTLSKGLRIFSVSCVGGAPIYRQLRSLRMHNHFIVGTPGRTQDLIRRRAINPSRINRIVLDEADQMLDMGFIDSMKEIIKLLPPKHQTLFFAATMSRAIESLIHEFLVDPVTVSVKSQDAAINVEQDVVRIGKRNKIDVLTELLGKEEFSKVVVFGKTKRGVESLSKTLVDRGVKAVSIHGDKSQGQRQQALNKFKNSFADILVATDVAARGIHVDDVTHVINFDLPATQDDYIHRIGRTGRGTSQGKALTFII